jgi:hypothetical protein
MITIILPISRSEYLKPVFDCLNVLERPSDTELLIITDGDKGLERAVEKRLDSINYCRVRVVSYGEKPAETINERRYRISEIHNKAKNYIPKACQYVYLIEDDTTYPPDTLTKMLELFDKIETAGYVEGVQLGRRNVPYVGAWHCDNLADPKQFISALPHSEEYYEHIDAGGLYCCLVRTELYKSHHFEPFDRQGTNGLSCDLNFGLCITRQDYDCFIDWSIQTDHVGDKGSVNLGNTEPKQVKFTKNYKGDWSCERVSISDSPAKAGKDLGKKL